MLQSREDHITQLRWKADICRHRAREFQSPQTRATLEALALSYEAMAACLAECRDYHVYFEGFDARH